MAYLSLSDPAQPSPRGIPPRNTLIVEHFDGVFTNRVYVIMSPEFVKDFERVAAACDTQIQWQSLPRPQWPTEVEDFERLEHTLRGLAALVDETYEPNCHVLPILEKALERLERFIDEVL